MFGGGGVKNYDIWDKHGGHKSFSVPFKSVGADFSIEANFVWIRSVDGQDFNVSDFSGESTAYNVSLLYGGYSITITNSYLMREAGATMGAFPFTITVTPGVATPISSGGGYSITEGYLKTGGYH